MTKPWLVLNSEKSTVTDRQAHCFRFSEHHHDPAGGETILSYDVDGRSLQEKLTFPWAPWPVDASRQAAFLKALELLHLVGGISYYKAGLARHIDPGECRIDAGLARFLNTLYSKGLGEFSYTNRLDLSGLTGFEVNFDAKGETTGSAPAGPTTRARSRHLSSVPTHDQPEMRVISDTGIEGHSQALDLPERALVAMGGGKDSLVCLQMLMDAGIEVQPVCVGTSGLIGETVKTAGLPLIRIRRELSSELIEMNANGAWNGHVPVTAINSSILICAALLYGYRYIVFANESSANEATLSDDKGLEINHQYSKSFAFEKDFCSIIQTHISPDVEYFSLLRPFNEISIARKFSKMTDFHSVFSSCNRNFHQDGSRIKGRWCQDCPKCRFTALALAPFISPPQLSAIQGVDMLDMESQLEGFKALCGIGNQKPFECVGTISEARAAMKCLTKSPLWRDKKIVEALAAYTAIKQSGELELEPDLESGHCIPDTILAKMNAL